MKHNITTRTSIGIIGMPRSGTTIVASFINSLDRATIWGEAHRVWARTSPIMMDTRYGIGVLRNSGDVLGQVKAFAEKNDLLIYGTKDVLDGIVTDPIATYRSYGWKYDQVFVVFRNPRKVWASMKSLGNASGLGMTEDRFIQKSNAFVDYCIRTNNATPIILERFREDPIKYMSTKMGLEISGPVILEKYSGTGDRGAMHAKEIRPITKRMPDDSPALDRAVEAYMEVL